MGKWFYDLSSPKVSSQILIEKNKITQMNY